MAGTINRQDRGENGGAREPASFQGHVAPQAWLSLRGVLAGLFVLLVAAVCISFGFWQLDRLEQRRALNATLLAALEEPILALDAPTAARLARDPDAYLYRRVRVRGRFEPVSDVVLRGRSHEGRTGVHLLTPLQIENSGLSVLVNRGWVPAADAVTVDPRHFADPGLQEIEGLLQSYPAAEGAGVPTEFEVDGFRVFSLSRLDFRALETRSEGSLQRFYIQQLPVDGSERPLRLAVPAVSEGSHLSYAIQWFSFAAIFVVGFLIVAIRRPRPIEPLPTAPEG